ncbi:MAG: DUF4445 domain-containing protein [bacterium]|nr:DUF4445 domain-containing protein [bacterium]
MAQDFLAGLTTRRLVSDGAMIEALKHMKLTFQPENRSITILPGQTVLQGARQADIELIATCGEKGNCRSCRIQLLEGELTPPSHEEQQRLGAQEIDRNFRLGCHARVLNDSIVRIAPPLSEQSLNILSEAEGVRYELDPDIVKHHIELPQFQDELQSSEFEEICRKIVESSSSGAVDTKKFSIDLAVLQQLPSFLQQHARDLTVVCWKEQLFALESGDSTADMYGIAFDIGTTTVVGYLMDLRRGKRVAVVSELNAQAMYGGDLMSRITFAQQEGKGRQILHEKILQSLNKIIEELCEQAEIERDWVYELTIVGNSCMHHLCLNIDPVQLGIAPYMAAIRQRYVTSAAELGIHIHPRARVVMLPLIAGFVGADTVGVILATALHKSGEFSLAVDIGTNGEIVFASPNRVLACSTAAGTAFEGAQIRHGMRGASGAIERVSIDDGDVRCHVIGDGPALGICGSGLVDAIAQMLDAGIVQPGGRLLTSEEAERKGIPVFLHSRLRKKGKEKQFILLNGEQCENGEAIVITQQDIREVQLAKGAIAAGIMMLMNMLGVRADDIHEILLAGAFGNYIDPQSALRIGLIPALPLERIRSVGNAAGRGAQLALLSNKAKHEADVIAEQTEHIALTNDVEFHVIFAENMGFPEPTQA